MSVYKREYLHNGTRKPAWVYSFVCAKVRYRKAGFATKSDAELAEAEAKRKVMLEGKRRRPGPSLTLEQLAKHCFDLRDATKARRTVYTERKRMRTLTE